MSTPLVKVFWIGTELPETQIFSSASRSKVPAVSTAKCVMLRYGIEWYSTFLPVMPCLSTRISRRSVNMMTSRTSWYAACTTSPAPSSLPKSDAAWPGSMVCALPKSAMDETPH